MILAIAIGTHNLSAVPVILAVVVIGVAVYVIRQRRRNQPNGRDR